MSNYSRVKDFSVKDALPTGDANKKILGSDMDAELDAVVVSNNTKADKVTSPTSGAYLVQDSNGNLADGGTVISGFSDTLLDDADADAARVTLGIETGPTGALEMPSGTTAQQPGSPSTGNTRYNEDDNQLEVFDVSWGAVSGTPDVITTRGDLIRGDASGDAERLALGATGKVFVSDGTDAAWGDRLLRGTQQATTSGTAFDFTGLPSGVKRVTVVFDAVSLSASDRINVQLGGAGGVKTTGYASTSSQLASGSQAVTASTSGFYIFTNGAGDRFQGRMVLENIGGTSWVGAHTGDLSTTVVAHGGGAVDLGEALTTVRVTRSGSDTFDAGSVNIIYE